MEFFFELKEAGTTISTEILAGLTTFFAMVFLWGLWISVRLALRIISRNHSLN